jgi:hypothetical protein
MALKNDRTFWAEITKRGKGLELNKSLSVV